MVARPEGGIDVAMYTALKMMPLDDALDLMEIDDVARSWRAAAMKNIAWRKANEASSGDSRRGTG